MSDIIDLSKVTSDSSVRVIDFREFVSIWCGMNMDFACSRYPEVQSSFFESSTQCGSELSGNNGNCCKMSLMIKLVSEQTLSFAMKVKGKFSTSIVLSPVLLSSLFEASSEYTDSVNDFARVDDWVNRFATTAKRQQPTKVVHQRMHHLSRLSTKYQQRLYFPAMT
ncbi:hypothetical protein POM88_033354 [Heracleum sosnowskyi]|uniref:Uncharacterized protein n=1 Tax=Heracleum sosnowskyi TaxID=360622 RepID=A0AAD8MKX4_9APIA|nr:hypothetical protein POM88_033354 [Heracleum sosnowskyi]